MKRIVCVLLTLIMLLGLIPTAAFAAEMEVSKAAITILKQFETFEDDCWEGKVQVAGKTVYYTGYGTVCTKTHKEEGNTLIHVDKDGKELPKTTQTEADEALKAALDELDDKINAFAASSGVSLSQHEHDALVIFSYDAGAGWITGSGVVRNAILQGGGVNELLNAFANWGGYEDRRTIEVNMYVNGIYASDIPTSYTAVTYNANEGNLAQTSPYTYHFDSGKSVNHPVTPTRTGYKFLGWYNASSAPSVRYDNLTKDCAGKTLYALWQANSTTAKNAATTATAVNYTLKASDLLEKRMYYTPEIGASSWEITSSSVTVSKEFVDANGQRWGCVHSGGNRWIRLSGSKILETTDGTIPAFQVTVTVTNSYVNRRVNADAGSAKNGSYSKGTELLIIDEDGGWGQVGEIQEDGKIEAVGWVSLMYTNWGSVSDGATSSTSGAVVATATVTFNGYLNIRSEAGTDNKIVGALAKNDTVDIFEIKTVNGHQWGRCSNGWICLSYAKLENQTGSDTAVDAGAQSYIYTGSLKAGTVLYTDAVENTAIEIEESPLTAATEVKILQLKAGANDSTWVKALWYVDKDKDKDATKEAAVTGWTQISNLTMDAATYTVSCEELNVRSAAGTENTSVFKLAKGVQVKVTEVKLVGESIWGKVPAHSNGWINLATKYVTRGDSIVIEDNTSVTSDQIGTVINTDSLRVRSTGATYGTQIGRLSRGTTVAVWEEDDGWYKVDSNQNGTYDYEDDGWVSGSYLDVRTGTVGGNSTVTDAAGNKYTTDGTGKGIVANTYSGVNVRAGAGTGYAAKGKLLPGTVVEILELANGGKWGRTAQGWVSMDYITMVSYNESVNTNTNLPSGGIQVESFDKAEVATKTAVYTGTLKSGAVVRSDADTNATELRTTSQVENITIHELAVVKTVVSTDSKPTAVEGNKDSSSVTTTTITETTYWARINDGWVKDPATYITLNALDEKVHTLTGKDTLDMYVNGTKVTLKKGDQVKVTALYIKNNTVIGTAETNDGRGEVDLSYFSEGAIYEAPKVENNTTSNNTTTITPPTLGNGSSTGGYVNNTSGYRYTGTVIRANELNVRATPSTTASKTTTLRNGQALVIYETMNSEGMAWGRCDAGWVYLYYVDLVPVTGAVDARVVANDNAIVYTDMNGSAVAGTYARQAVIDIYEIVGKMARTDLGWISTDNLL